MTHGAVCGSVSATRKIVGVDACDSVIIDLVIRRLSNLFLRRKFDVWASSRKSWRTRCSRMYWITHLDAAIRKATDMMSIHERVVGGEIRRTQRAGRVGLLRRVSLIPHRYGIADTTYLLILTMHQLVTHHKNMAIWKADLTLLSKNLQAQAFSWRLHRRIDNRPAASETNMQSEETGFFPKTNCSWRLHGRIDSRPAASETEYAIGRDEFLFRRRFSFPKRQGAGGLFYTS